MSELLESLGSGLEDDASFSEGSQEADLGSVVSRTEEYVLVEYDDPIIVNGKGEVQTKYQLDLERQQMSKLENKITEDRNTDAREEIDPDKVADHPEFGAISSGKIEGEVDISTTGDDDLDEILNTIVPPRIFKLKNPDDPDSYYSDDSDSLAGFSTDEEEAADEAKEKIGDGVLPPLPPESEFPQPLKKKFEDKLFRVQYVSKVPVSRESVDGLRERFNKEMLRRQARINGLCDVKDDIHWKLFDELIRQCFLNMPERAVLLEKIRAESMMKLDAYRMILSDSIAFGMAKLVLNEDKNSDLANEISEREKRNSELTQDLELLKKKMEVMKKTEDLKKEIRDEDRERKLVYLRNQEENLTKFLKSISNE